MLHDLPSYRARCESSIGLEDITTILAVRLHEGNPWVAERLSAMASHYRVLSPTVVVDFGSDEPHRSTLRKICEEHGFSYVFEDDPGVFSLARARNVGARASKTRLLFFNDVDCFGAADLYERLAEHAHHLQMGSYLEQVINLPVYHLAEADTRSVWARAISERGQALARIMARMTYRAFETESHAFVDPSSNFFVIRRDFFELVGGYNEGFRGHGSEDFEFFLRLSHFTTQFPLPQAPAENLYSPFHASFFGYKAYRGFRRYMELMAQQAECAGLRIAHLNHPRGQGAWYSEGDRAKTKLAREVNGFLSNPSALIERDWLPREKRALILLKHERQYQYFLPLRLQGFRLHLMRLGDPESEQRAASLLTEGGVDQVFVFNPYMSSHKGLSPWVARARTAGIAVTVVDRGMLPESWFFAEDMPYGDSEYERLDLDAAPIAEDELAIADEYAARLQKGGATLEPNGDFAETMRRRGGAEGSDRTILVPLQVPDDVAVTHFNAQYQPYTEFVASIDDVARAHPRTRFLVKTHPLLNEPFTSTEPNVEVCDRRDNIHALIELSQAVVCYNSGVGFLALVHGKPLITLGNAFYNLPGTGHRASTLSHGLRLLEEGVTPPSAPLMRRYLAWHLFHKYAFFQAISDLEAKRTRQAHHYHHLAAYRLPQNALSTLLASRDHAFHPRSYAAGKLAISAVPLRSAVAALEERSPFVRKLRKLTRDPRAFARDSKMGRRFFRRR